MTVHVFDSSDEAYDASQCRGDIKNGDILIVPSEGVAGWLDQAWPIAATRTVGAFHGINVAAAIEAESFGRETGKFIADKVAEATAALEAHSEAALEDEAYAINSDNDAEVLAAS